MKPELIALVAEIQTSWKAVAEAIADDATLHARLKGVGVLPTDTAKEFCVIGPTARGSGIDIDSRVDHPYAAYDELVPEVITFDGCDNWARTLVRIQETFESIRLIRKGLDQLADGPIMAEIKEPIPPGREGVIVVEAPRGEAVHHLITGDDYRPLRWRVRAPTYQHLQALPAMIQDAAVADVPITLGSMDPCFSCTERLEVVDVDNNRITVYSNNDLADLSRRKYGKRGR
jgi:Ni,Fe-hydrogenase III large subunit